jgi:hypothetical protein
MCAEWCSGVRVEGSDQSWHGEEKTISLKDAQDMKKVLASAELENVRKIPLVGLEVTGEGDELETKSFETGLIGLYDSRGVILGSHGADTYHIHQPAETLKPYWEIIEADGRFQFDFLARLREGRVWVANFVLNEDELIVGEKHNFYIGVGSSFDGSRTTSVDASEIRKVCMNTVRLSDSMKTTVKTRFKHRRALPDGDTFRRQFENALNQRDSYKEFAELLAGYRLSKEKALEFLKGTIFTPKLVEQTTATGEKVEVWNEPNTRTKNRLELLEKSFETTLNETGNESSGWTVWNAITRFADHDSSIRMTEKRKEANSNEQQVRFENNLYGNSAAFKDSVIPALKELVAA